MTFWDLISQAASAAPSRVLLADDHGRSLTNAEFRDAADGDARRGAAGPYCGQWGIEAAPFQRNLAMAMAMTRFTVATASRFAPVPRRPAR